MSAVVGVAERSGDAAPRAVLAVLAKRPVAGQVKTRLAPALSPDASVGLYAAMLEDTLRIVADTAEALGLAWVWCAPPEVGADDPLAAARAWCGDRGLAPNVEAQAGGPLGARIRGALDAGRARAPRAIVVGADAPALGRARIEAALLALEAGAVDARSAPRAVLGPTDDGGFDLLAVDHTPRWLDAAIRWSTSEARADAVRAAEARGVHVRELDVGWDVDTPADLARLGAWLRTAPSDAALALRAWRARSTTEGDPLGPRRAPRDEAVDDGGTSR